MSLILFFGFSGSVVIVGFIYVFLALRHHWKQSKLAKQIDMPN
jgi:hypothetical protein